MYPEIWVTPMREELTRIGFLQLHTPADVDAALATEGTTLLVVNTFCPHAVLARPAVAQALQSAPRPDHLVTVFAGQDLAPTVRARTFLAPYQPSSPAFALFSGGKLIFMMERDQILGRPVEAIAADLAAAFGHFCVASGV